MRKRGPYPRKRKAIDLQRPPTVGQPTLPSGEGRPEGPGWGSHDRSRHTPPDHAQSARGRPPLRGGGSEPASPGLILVGRFGAPQGVRGEVRVQSFTGDPLALADYAPLTDASAKRVFTLTALRPLRDNMIVAMVDGTTDRDAAAALTGVGIFAPRDALPPPDEDEFYVADLVGLEAIDIDGNAIGRIVAVQNFGAGDLLEITPTEGGETLLVPFTKSFVPTLDLAARRVTCRLPQTAPAAEDDALA